MMVRVCIITLPLLLIRTIGLGVTLPSASARRLLEPVLEDIDGGSIGQDIQQSPEEELQTECNLFDTTISSPSSSSSSSSACPVGYYCNVADGECANADQDNGTAVAVAGICTKISYRCPKIFRQVCGCDGNTYSNSCLAGASGVNVAFFGVCESKDEGFE